MSVLIVGPVIHSQELTFLFCLAIPVCPF